MALRFKMPGLYLDILIIGHKFCSMLSILKEMTLQKEWQNILTINVFWTKENNHNNNNNKTEKET